MYGVLNCLPCELILWYIFPLSKMPLSPHPTRESLAGSEILARQLFILALWKCLLFTCVFRCCWEWLRLVLFLCLNSACKSRVSHCRRRVLNVAFLCVYAGEGVWILAMNICAFDELRVLYLFKFCLSFVLAPTPFHFVCFPFTLSVEFLHSFPCSTPWFPTSAVFNLMFKCVCVCVWSFTHPLGYLLIHGVSCFEFPFCALVLILPVLHSVSVFHLKFLGGMLAVPSCLLLCGLFAYRGGNFLYRAGQ